MTADPSVPSRYRSLRYRRLFQPLSWQHLNSIRLFITAFDDYALKAFEANAIDYLLKPVDEIELENAIRRLLKRMEEKSALIIGKTKTKRTFYCFFI